MDGKGCVYQELHTGLPFCGGNLLEKKGFVSGEN